MKTASWGIAAWIAAAVAVFPVMVGGAAFGAVPHVGQKIWLSCANGRDYPLQPTGVSRDSDIVTGYLLRTGTGHAIHLTLVPMGDGYRYTGVGTWFDGVRGDAVLNWGRSDAVSCTVKQD